MYSTTYRLCSVTTVLSMHLRAKNTDYIMPIDLKLEHVGTWVSTIYTYHLNGQL